MEVGSEWSIIIIIIVDSVGGGVVLFRGRISITGREGRRKEDIIDFIQKHREDETATPTTTTTAGESGKDEL